jgi:hypothetical protein
MTAALAVLEDERQILSAWTRLHGFVTLELGGNFASMGIDADVLFAGEVAAIVDAAPTSDQ